MTTPLIPAIRYAVRQLAAHGDTADVRSKIAASIRAGCEDDVPVSDEEIGIIMGEATRLSKGD